MRKERERRKVASGKERKRGTNGWNQESRGDVGHGRDEREERERQVMSDAWEKTEMVKKGEEGRERF